MRMLAVVGIILIAIGSYALVTGSVLTGRRDVVDVGGLKISTEQHRSVAPWMAGIALAIGGALVVAGATRKK